jgi:hypothetical protein
MIGISVSNGDNFVMQYLRREVILHFIDSFRMLFHSLLDNAFCSWGFLLVYMSFYFLHFSLSAVQNYLHWRYNRKQAFEIIHCNILK